MPSKTSKPTTVAQYLAGLPKDRRDALQAIRKVILDNLDTDYAEGIQYGMIGYFVPHSVYPDGYHCDRKQPLPYVSIASQKNHMAVYMFCIYTSEEEQRRGGLSRDWRAGVLFGYPLLREKGAELAASGVKFFDASRVFAGEDQTLYHDSCHFGKEANERLARAMAEEFLADLPPGPVK